jgi:hypothetical protein
MFLESARIFHLVRSHERFDQLLSKLRKSEASRRSLRVTLTTAYAGDIDDVQSL